MMTPQHLLDRNVKVRADSPINSDSFARIINVSEHERKLLLELEVPITISSVIDTHAVASPRLARDDQYALLDKGLLGCSVTWVPKQRFNQAKPFDLTWWRGGPAAITDVLLIDLQSLNEKYQSIGVYCGLAQRAEPIFHC